MKIELLDGRISMAIICIYWYLQFLLIYSKRQIFEAGRIYRRWDNWLFPYLNMHILVLYSVLSIQDSLAPDRSCDMHRCGRESTCTFRLGVDMWVSDKLDLCIQHYVSIHIVIYASAPSTRSTVQYGVLSIRYTSTEPLYVYIEYGEKWQF